MTSDNAIMAGTGPEAAHGDAAEWLRAASDPDLTEDLACALLKRADLPAEVLERLSKNASVLKRRKLKRAIVQHPKTPRHVTLPLLRHLFTFELMRVTLNPVALAGIRKVAEEALINRLESISLGEKLTLAHRASGHVAGELLLDPEPRVIQTALENSRLTEASVVKAILRDDAPAALVQQACVHPKWSWRGEVRIALLRNEHTPLARASEFARTWPAAVVKEILGASKLPEWVKEVLLEEIQGRRDLQPRQKADEQSLD
jgi:hypothetical protein